MNDEFNNLNLINMYYEFNHSIINIKFSLLFREKWRDRGNTFHHIFSLMKLYLNKKL